MSITRGRQHNRRVHFAFIDLLTSPRLLLWEDDLCPRGRPQIQAVEVVQVDETSFAAEVVAAEDQEVGSCQHSRMASTSARRFTF